MGAIYDAPVNSSRILVAMDLEARADVMKAVADPYRLEILEILSPEIRCNCHLQDRLDIAPNLLSYHLKVLREAGLIEGTKRGRWVDYALTEQAAEVIAAALPERLRP
jgi:ArsR family transcriptional regulator